jgi:PilZ domain
MKQRPLIFRIVAGVLTLVLFHSVLTYLQTSDGNLGIYVGYWLILFGSILSALAPRGLGHAAVTLTTFCVPVVEIWKFQSEGVTFSTFLAAATMGFGILAIADEQLQAVFHKPSMRWWETSQRYFLKAKAIVSWSDHNDEVDIKNISTTGCLAETKTPVSLNSPVRIKFNDKLVLNAVVVRMEDADLGIKFDFKNRHEQKNLREYIRETVAQQAT